MTFENTQKITSDLDELTGDPKFRQNLLQLVNGLSKLVSSTQDMQQQTKIAFSLDSIKTSVNQSQGVASIAKLKADIEHPEITQPTPKVKAILDKAKKVVTFAPPKREFFDQPELLAPLVIPTLSQQKEQAIQPLPTVVENSSQEQLLQKLRKYREGTSDR